MECYNSNRNAVGKGSITYAGTSGEKFTWTELTNQRSCHDVKFAKSILRISDNCHCKTFWPDGTMQILSLCKCTSCIERVVE